MNEVNLNFKSFGQGPPLVILHGFLGSLDNWQTVAKTLAEDYTVFTVDQRNHGKSPHAEEMNYKVMAEDLMKFLDEQWIHQTSIIGHSMGGKTAMTFANNFPDRLDKMIVVDIGPKAYPPGHDYILEALKEVPIEKVSSRNEVDEILAKHIDKKGVRLFLMKNLSRTKDGFRWKMNLPVLIKHYEEVTSAVWPDELYEGDTLFIRGTNSNYITDHDWPEILHNFHNAELVDVREAGHWVHAEKPQEMIAAVRQFMG